MRRFSAPDTIAEANRLGFQLGRPQTATTTVRSRRLSDHTPISVLAQSLVMATYAAPRKPAALVRSCVVDPSDPMSPSGFRLFNPSLVCHCAASRS
jgi:hypothetical protein